MGQDLIDDDLGESGINVDVPYYTDNNKWLTTLTTSAQIILEGCVICPQIFR